MDEQVLSLIAMSDQAREGLRQYRAVFERIVETDPEEWTVADRRIIRMALAGLIGLIYEGIV